MVRDIRRQTRRKFSEGRNARRQWQHGVDLLVAHLLAQRSIWALASNFAARYDRLQLLIRSAGNSFMTRPVSEDGIELSLAVNHLASFLLTNLLLDRLLDRLKTSAPARIVNVGTRLNTALDFDDLQFERRKYQGLSAYAQSKLGNLHFMFELAERMRERGVTNVTVNCVHPGVFRSNLGSSGGPNPLWMVIVTAMGRPFLNSAEKAAERVL